MITTLEEYKRKLYEIQEGVDISTQMVAPESEPRFEIDLNTRTIAIPEEFKFLATKNEHRAETIYFICDRYFDDIDLTTKNCVVQFLNYSGSQSNEGLFPVTEMDTETEEGKIIFGWTICNESTQIAGDISFAITFFELDENQTYVYNLTTLPTKSSILDTLDIKENSANPYLPSELQEWLDRINQISKDAQAQVDNVKQEIKDFGKMADFYLDGNTLCANVATGYTINAIQIDDDGYLTMILTV